MALETSRQIGRSQRARELLQQAAALRERSRALATDDASHLGDQAFWTGFLPGLRAQAVRWLVHYELLKRDERSEPVSPDDPLPAAFALSPDGRWLATAYVPQEPQPVLITVRNLDTGQVDRRFHIAPHHAVKQVALAFAT